MANRYYSEFKERKITGGGRRPAPGQRGTAGAETGGRAPTEKTVAWPDPGPHWGSSFNRKTKVPVVKIRAKKGGLD